MKTRFKGYDIEINHDVVWGFNFVITDPLGKTFNSNDVSGIDESSSWTTQNEAYDFAIATIEADIMDQEYNEICKDDFHQKLP